MLSLIGYSGDSTLPLNNATVLINALRNNPAQVTYEKHTAGETKSRKQADLHRMEKWAKENPVAASAISLVSKPISGVDYLNALVQSVAIGEVLPSGLPSLSETTQGLRAGASENLGKTGQFIYNGVMSAADSVIAGALGNGSVGGGIILGFGTASDSANDIMERGGTEEQALIGGAVSGILEGVFEKLSLGQLGSMKALPADTVKNILGNIAKSVVTNAGEEFSTELANALFDRVFMGELSTYELSVKSYMSQGMSEAVARKLANRELLERLCESAASGALTGVLFGGGASADSYHRSRVAAQGEARLRAGEMPTPKQLEAMNLSEAEARGALVMMNLDQVDGADTIQTGQSFGENSGVVITDGSHLKDGQLKPNVTYKTGEHDYIYQTNEAGLISRVIVDVLHLKTHDGRLKHNPNTYGKQEGDHAGHLIGDRFGGSPKLDNLVSQAKHVNMREYKAIENQWAEALKNGKKVSVKIDIKYSEGKSRPSSFVVSYDIDGTLYFKKIKN